MPAATIDFETITHVIHFAATPHADGSLDWNSHGLTSAKSADLISQAHAAGRRVLICIGGAGSQAGFRGAASAPHLGAFINGITNLMATRGYDGVDIDWEPLPETDASSFTDLIDGLRRALDGFPEPRLLTAAVGAYPPYGDSPAAHYGMYAGLQDQFDQLNVMTYDLSGPYPGWVTWFNSPLYDGGLRFPNSSRLVPSIDAAIHNFLSAGVAPGRLAIGIPFYGDLWTDGRGTSPASLTQPRQSWTSAPTVTAIRYSDIMTTYYDTNHYHWDAVAQSAYLSITNSNPTENTFLSFDDQRTCEAKVSYARNHGLGGIMIWQLAQDHRGGRVSPLVRTINRALATPRFTGVQWGNDGVTLTFDGVALGSYRVQWTSDLTAPLWQTLWITNLNAGGAVQVTDTSAMTGPTRRFYRIQTPP